MHDYEKTHYRAEQYIAVVRSHLSVSKLNDRGISASGREAATGSGEEVISHGDEASSSVAAAEAGHNGHKLNTDAAAAQEGLVGVMRFKPCLESPVIQWWLKFHSPVRVVLSQIAGNEFFQGMVWRSNGTAGCSVAVPVDFVFDILSFFGASNESYQKCIHLPI